MIHYNSTKQLLFSILLLVISWGCMLPSVLATHEVDHRFTVHGTVRDGRSFPGKLLGGKDVVVRDSKTGQILQQGVTNDQGQFSLVLHVHNEDKGRNLTIQSEGIEKPLELRFEPDDQTTERQMHIDLIVMPK